MKTGNKTRGTFSLDAKVNFPLHVNTAANVNTMIFNKSFDPAIIFLLHVCYAANPRDCSLARSARFRGCSSEKTHGYRSYLLATNTHMTIRLIEFHATLRPFIAALFRQCAILGVHNNNKQPAACSWIEWKKEENQIHSIAQTITSDIWGKGKV